MTTTFKGLRVLIVDDNRDGADALGLLVEELGNQVHVTYSGLQALDVATAFRADLLLLDLVMPGMDGCNLAMRFRQLPSFARTTIVAITGHKSPEHAAMAMKAGFDALLTKPATISEIRAILNSVVVDLANRSSTGVGGKRSLTGLGGLPIDEARRLRNDRTSKTLTQAESEAAIREGFFRFQEEYLGRKSDEIRAHFVNDLLVVRVLGTMTQAEKRLGSSVAPGQGRDLIKQVRKQLVELARPMLESLIHEVAGVKAISMHYDISTVTGEEVVLFSLVSAPRFG